MIEAILWACAAIVLVLALVGIVAALGSRGPGRRPRPPEIGDDIHQDGTPFGDAELDRYIASWEKGDDRG